MESLVKELRRQLDLMGMEDFTDWIHASAAFYYCAEYSGGLSVREVCRAVDEARKWTL